MNCFVASYLITAGLRWNGFVLAGCSSPVVTPITSSTSFASQPAITSFSQRLNGFGGLMVGCVVNELPPTLQKVAAG